MLITLKQLVVVMESDLQALHSSFSPPLGPIQPHSPHLAGPMHQLPFLAPLSFPSAPSPPTEVGPG